jgi:hypothetical protein
MNRPYKNLKTVFIYNSVGNRFIKKINIPFNVDEIVLKSYTAHDRDTGNNQNISILACPLVMGPLLSVSSGVEMSIFCNSQFIGPHTPIDSEFEFRWLQFDGSAILEPLTFEINIILQLVFIEY